MKLKIDWKTLGRMIWDAVKPDVDASVVPKCPRTPSGLSVLPPDHLRVLPKGPQGVLPGDHLWVYRQHPWGYYHEGARRYYRVTPRG